MHTARCSVLGLAVLATAAIAAQPPATSPSPKDPVGPGLSGSTRITTSQLVRPAGQTTELTSRPVDLVLSPDGKHLVAKDNRGLVLLDATTLKILHELKFDGAGGSMSGLALSSDSRTVYATDSKNTLHIASIDAGVLKPVRKIALAGPGANSSSYPCGVALTGDGKSALVCLSRNNTLAIVDLASGTITKEIPVGVAPFAVRISSDGASAFVTNWGGRRAKPDDRAANSSGTPTVIDSRGIAASGTVSLIDLAKQEETVQIETGLSPCALELSSDNRTLYIANANSDTVSVIDVAAKLVTHTFSTRPDSALPFGSMPNGLALAADGSRLYVSNAGNNAVAVLSLLPGATSGNPLLGLIPTGWYPGALVLNGDQLSIASIKGVGSRTRGESERGFRSNHHRGTISRVNLSGDIDLPTMTALARHDARVPEILRAIEHDENLAAAVPIPAQPGEPSVFRHVVYIIKENRTYDQVFGDIPRGNRDESLCTFGRDVTPNHHALAEQFVLLDNFYCNGVLSADGHSWATEGNVTPYLERSFGGFERSYSFGDDPLTYSSSGFIWDHILAAGFSFRNYGEFDYASTEPPSGYKAIYEDFVSGKNAIKRKQKIGVERMRTFACPDYPGWNMDIPDVLRADIFLKELAQAEAADSWPNFMIVYLPNDHTAGNADNSPTPASLVADNDLALGRVVEGITKSKFWPKTCIFVVEDDPQDGWDHVDGHRSIAQVISPYTKRGALVSNFYNQASVIHTIERVFGLVAANQLYAAAPLMTDCFTNEPDLTPFTCLPNIVPLAQLNKRAEAPTPQERELAEAGRAQRLDVPDAINEDIFNRVLWHSVKGDTPYPAHLAGAHGAGLPALGLKHDPAIGIRDDDDDDK